MSDKLSRRDFLKLAGVGTLGFSFRKPIETVDKASIEVEQEKTFETDKAIFTPFFELHTRRNTDQRIIDVEPDYLFIEFMSNTDRLLNNSPFEILAAKSQVPGNTTIDRPSIDTGRFLSYELLVGLDEAGSSVSIEGIDIPPKLKEQASVVNMFTNVVPGLTTLASLGIALGRLVKTGEFSNGDHTRIYASILANLWATSDELTGSGILLTYDKDDDSPQTRNAQNIANRINAVVTLAHPEDVIIFMRNIFMSLKLIALSEQGAKDDDEKLKIAFRIGAGHGAVSDLVKMGKEVVVTMLDIYPINILKNIIEFNTSAEKTFDKRIEDFCKIIVIPIHEARTTDTGTKHIVDDNLKSYFQKRFEEKSEK